MEWKVQRNIEWQLFRSSARTYQTVSARHEFWIKLCSFWDFFGYFYFPMPYRSKISSADHGLITERQSLQTYNSKSILTLHRPETPSTDLVSHNIPLHAVSAKSRIKDTANIIYIITPDLKIWLKWIKSLSNPNPKKKKKAWQKINLHLQLKPSS